MNEELDETFSHPAQHKQLSYALTIIIIICFIIRKLGI